MIKASALYIVIIIALVIAAICSSLIVVAYYYRMEDQQKQRFDRLRLNMASGVNILLADSVTYTEEKTFDLFGRSTDSVTLHRYPWGIYDIGVAKAFVQNDTIFSAFQIGGIYDLAQSPALYLIDEDRPLSVSGKTSIEGLVYIPKAGIRAAYVNNEAYQGDKEIVRGKIKDSQRTLPSLDVKRIQALRSLFSSQPDNRSESIQQDTISQLFRSPQKHIALGKEPYTFSNISVTGHVLITSDTTITLDSTAKLQNVVIAAKTINVKSGFKGTCQLFAVDSIVVGDRATFEYPSCLGILGEKAAPQHQLKFGNNCTLNGIAFTCPVEGTQLPPFLQMGENVTVHGQVYAGGILSIKNNLVIKGAVYASRFLYQSNYSAYENYLINFNLSSKALSKYYLTGLLLPFTNPQKRVLQWLEK